MELRHLRHFQVLAESGSLHRAARKLSLRPPALSQSIRALEVHVGTRLVVRAPSGTRLTPAGEVFLSEIQHILTTLQRAVHLTHLAATAAKVPFRLGGTDDAVIQPFMVAIDRFRQAVPNSLLSYCEADASRLLAMLTDGVLDAAVMPAAADTEQVMMEVVWQEDIQIALPSDHPLAAEEPIDLNRLAGTPIVTGPVTHPNGPDHLLATTFTSNKIVPTMIATTNQLQLRLILVANGLGMTAIPTTRSSCLELSDVVIRRLNPPLHMNIALAWPKFRLNSQTQRFIDIARSIRSSSSLL